MRNTGRAMFATHNSNIKLANDFERQNKLDEALYKLILGKKSNTIQPLYKLYDLNIERIVFKAKKKAYEFMQNLNPLSIHEQINNPNSYAQECNNDKKNEKKPLISLTTISSRIDKTHQTIKTILKQTAQIHSINLYISDAPYLIDDGINSTDRNLLNIADLGVNIYSVPNIGPYRKQIPIIKQLQSGRACPETIIITIDDDVLYPNHIIQTLVDKIDANESVIAHRGREITIKDQELIPYMSFPPPSHDTNIANIGTGKNGIAYRLKHFPKTYEDYVGHILAPTADDIWCKWATSINCIPTTILEPSAAFNPNLDFQQTDANDKKGLFYKYNVSGTNDKAMLNIDLYFSHKRKNLVNFLKGNNYE